MKRDCECPRARHEHGTLAAYRLDRCRCFACRVAHSSAQSAYRAGGTWREGRLVDGAPTRLRLQALATNGLPADIIGARLGITGDAVCKLRTARTVNVTSAARVAAVYDELWNVHGTGRSGNYVRAHAARKGWLPPLALDDDKMQMELFRTPPDIENRVRDGEAPGLQPDVHLRHHDSAEYIDEIAVQRAIHGDRVRLTKAELSYAIATMTRMEYGAEEIARRLRISERTVERYRAKEVA